MSDNPLKDVPVGGWHSVEGHTARPEMIQRQVTALRQLRDLLRQKLEANRREADTLRLQIRQSTQGGGS